MQPHAAERRSLERQLALARPVCLVLALVGLLEGGVAPGERPTVALISVYLAAAIGLAILENSRWWSGFRVPVAADLAALGMLLVLTPSLVAFWFPFLFVAYVSAVRWELRRGVMLAGAGTLALLVRTVIREPVNWPQMFSWVALVAGTFGAGVGLAFLGARQRHQAAEQAFLARLLGMLQVEQGIAESVRQVLDELARAFDCETALLVFADRELDRIFLWRLRPDVGERITPENVPRERADAYFLDCLDTNLCWNSLEGPGQGFGWNRLDGMPVAEIPRVPGPSREALNLRSVMAATFEFRGQPVGRILLCNSRRELSPTHLRRLERILGHLGPQLENLFLLRLIRARAIEGERGRISRDLHDGILQTLFSIQIQLDVLQKKLPQAAGQVAGDLAALEQTLRNETQELRRLVTDLRPLHLQSADLADMMRGVADRFRSEAGIPVDILVDNLHLQAPDRVSREVFQIFREALHNIRKHARATHIVVKLWQDEAKLSLVVDDNGQGFSFAGRFTSEELDRLRLGPISIKERVRGVGGMLTVESIPGHGARLTVEIPLG